MAGTDSESQQTSIDCDDLRAVFFAKSLPETMQGITGLSPARTPTYSTYPLRYLHDWRFDMKRVILFALLWIVPLRIFAADAIPDNRKPFGGTWAGKVGVPGGIPNRTIIFRTLSPGATAAQIQDALDNCPSGQVVKLAAGTFGPYTSSFRVGKNDITLRGSTDSKGVPATTLLFSGHTLDGQLFFSKSGIGLPDSGGLTTRSISSGLARGSTSVTVSSAPTGLSADQMMCLDVVNDGNVILGGGTWARNGNRALMQFVHVTNVSGNTITFEPALDADYWNAGSSPEVWYRSKDQEVSGSGAEDIWMKRTSTGVGHHTTAFQGARNCWLKNVYCTGVSDSSYHVWLLATLNIEIRHCKFSEHDSLQSSTYDIFPSYSSGVLVEDNIFHKSPNYIAIPACSGSAFAYNYFFDEPYASPDWLSQIVFTHGGHSNYNLFEGNHVPAHYNDFQTDHHSRNNTYVRERILGWDATGPKTQNTHCLSLEQHQDNWTMVGCVLGKLGYHTVYSSTSSNVSIFKIDPDSAPTLVRKGNYNTVDNGIPASEALGSDTVQASYLHPSKPAWFGSLPWPPVDPANPTAAVPTNIPSGYRWVNGADPVAGTSLSPPQNLRVTSP